MVESGKKISELRVCDLKDELEKRKLETIGPKAVLIERLERALKEEGVDPNTHLIVPAAKNKKPVPVPMKEADPEVKIKDEPLDDEDGVQGNAQTDGDVDGVGDNGAKEYSAHDADDNGHEIDQVGDVDDECVILDDDDDDEDDEDAHEKYAQKQSENIDVVIKAEAVSAGDEDMQEENTGDTVNMDNDESINLTIGEEEQKLLHDEAPDDKSVKSVKPSNKSDKSSANSKDADKKSHKDDDAGRAKKKDDKSADKKDSSEQKSSGKSSNQKDDKG
ncbi:SAFB-like transcription modulator isoform X2 [Drosophila busckii]|nr:SAFB-like transcription modulator isoform X2 [Drosophila busckii]